jgi:hypothetical protein
MATVSVSQFAGNAPYRWFTLLMQTLKVCLGYEFPV